MRLGHPRQRRDAVVLAGVQDVLVDFVGHHVHIRMAAHHVGDGSSSSSVNAEPQGFSGELMMSRRVRSLTIAGQLRQVGMVGPVFQQLHGDGPGAAKLDH